MEVASLSHRAGDPVLACHPSLVFNVSGCLYAAPHLCPLCLGFPTVVSLRQIQHKATWEKERSQELRRLQEEAWKEEGLRLTQRLQHLERDKDLMLVGKGGGHGLPGEKYRKRKGWLCLG